MGKGSGLAILALIIGIGGLGFGIFTYFTLNQNTQTESSVHHTYFDSRTTAYTSPAEDSWYEITDLSITFQVASGESVYFLFTCAAYLSPVSGVWLMRFQLNIDDTSITESRTMVGLATNDVSYMYFSVALQYEDSAVLAGSHEVTVETYRECAGNIWNCHLLVQTYIP